jgi:hypothetical protein
MQSIDKVQGASKGNPNTFVKLSYLKQCWILVGITPRKNALKKAKGKIIMHNIVINVIKTITIRNNVFSCTWSRNKVNPNPLIHQGHNKAKNTKSKGVLATNLAPKAIQR